MNKLQNFNLEDVRGKDRAGKRSNPVAPSANGTAVPPIDAAELGLPTSRPPFLSGVPFGQARCRNGSMLGVGLPIIGSSVGS